MARINQDYVLADETEREILTQICEAQDHCAELCEGIKSDEPKMAPEKALQDYSPVSRLYSPRIGAPESASQ